MTPDGVARIVERRSEPNFAGLVRDADGSFVDSRFEAALADVLRGKPQLVDLWTSYSADQRSTPSSYVEANETGWYDAGCRQFCVHPGEDAAVADFIHRRVAWLVRREVVD
jgi:hypothetical protein